MSRAARKPKTKDELQDLSLEQLNTELRYLRIREHVSGSSSAAKSFRKEIAAIENVRLCRFGISSRKP